MTWGSGTSRPRGAGHRAGSSSLSRGKGRPSDPQPDSQDANLDAGDGDVAPSVDTQQEKRGPSLKARGVGYLSRREYARDELSRKLSAHSESAEQLQGVLDDLEREGWLSTERFAQSLVHRRAERQGVARIVQELRQHGVQEDQIGDLREKLRATEYERALAVWQKRYDERPADRAAYAKQARFLAGRGFAHDVIRRILGDDE